jgi:hypothetical protein
MNSTHNSRFKILTAIPPLPQNAFMAWCSDKNKRAGTNLPLPLSYLKRSQFSKTNSKAIGLFPIFPNNIEKI